MSMQAGPTEHALRVSEYRVAFERWLEGRPDVLERACVPRASYAARVEAMRALMTTLHAEGWSRYGWPEELGGLGGTIAHRAAMWEALARHGVPGMALFEHLEVLAPTLVEHGPVDFIAEALPRFLAGEDLWSQGFSEPSSGSDLASLRTTARTAEGAEQQGYVINGRKIWTSWSVFATWCLVLARTGAPDSRHRGLTAFVVDLRAAGVEVRPIEQANGTEELAEVTFDNVFVPVDRIVGEVGGGWSIAMHILSHERGTFAWFRHTFLYTAVRDATRLASPGDDGQLGNGLLDLAAVTAAGIAAIEAHGRSEPLGPKAAFTKLLLCNAEQSINDWILATDPELTLENEHDELAARRQEYLFSRIVTVYGGSQQMQLETIAKQILRLP
jgi:alkylation response protein AidB-like acyl-CoA dehydrogenase